MGCEDEACRSYLRIVRTQGKHAALALFELAVTSAQHADLQRALSYFEAFSACDREEVSPEMAMLLHKQLLQALDRPVPVTRRGRAKILERRAVENLHAGRFRAAARTADHALRLFETPQACLIKACSHLVLGEAQEAVSSAKKALEIRPGHVQSMCVLADALCQIGDESKGKRLLYTAATRAKSNDSLFTVAVECAKRGMDRMTLVLTKRLLKREPCHIRAIAMRACAFYNLGGVVQATRLFGRLCTLLPEDNVFDAYYKTLLRGDGFDAPLTMAQDVTPQEAMARSMKLVAAIGEDPSKIRQNKEDLRELCRYADWAMHSPMTGSNVTLIAVIMLSALDMPRTCGVLHDALTDPRLDDGLKMSILQALNVHTHEQPVYADLGGRLVRLAAGACVPSDSGAQGCQEVVQRAANGLMRRYPRAAQQLLDLWVPYLEFYGPVGKKHTDACAAALEYVFHVQEGRHVHIEKIARRYAVSARLAAKYAGRLVRAAEKHTTSNEKTTEEFE